MSEADQCRALTGDGERCTRPAQDDGFCYQHGPDDETINSDDDEAGNEAEDENVSENSTDGEETTAERDESDDDNSNSDESNESQNGEFDVMDVRETVEGVATDLVGHPLDGIIEIAKDDDGWEVVVEMVERSAVPDTQDILGQYAIALSESGGVTGYRLRERYRRGDSQEW